MNAPCNQSGGEGGGGVSWVCILGVFGLILGILILTRPVDEPGTRTEWFQVLGKRKAVPKPKPKAAALRQAPGGTTHPNAQRVPPGTTPGVRPITGVVGRPLLRMKAIPKKPAAAMGPQRRIIPQTRTSPVPRPGALPSSPRPNAVRQPPAAPLTMVTVAPPAQ